MTIFLTSGGYVMVFLPWLFVLMQYLIRPTGWVMEEVKIGNVAIMIMQVGTDQFRKKSKNRQHLIETILNPRVDDWTVDFGQDIQNSHFRLWEIVTFFIIFYCLQTKWLIENIIGRLIVSNGNYNCFYKGMTVNGNDLK